MAWTSGICKVVSVRIAQERNCRRITTKGENNMDPNANLKEQIELAKEAIECGGFAHPEDAVRLAALVIAFDEWMRKGGFLPDTWTLSANETRRERLKI